MNKELNLYHPSFLAELGTFPDFPGEGGGLFPGIGIEPRGPIVFQPSEYGCYYKGGRRGTIPGAREAVLLVAAAVALSPLFGEASGSAPLEVKAGEREFPVVQSACKADCGDGVCCPLTGENTDNCFQDCAEADSVIFLPEFGGITTELTGPENLTALVRVREGDTLARIAEIWGTTVENILKLNPQIKNPNLIYSDQEFSVPISNVDPDNNHFVIYTAGDGEIDTYYWDEEKGNYQLLDRVEEREREQVEAQGRKSDSGVLMAMGIPNPAEICRNKGAEWCPGWAEVAGDPDGLAYFMVTADGTVEWRKKKGELLASWNEESGEWEASTFP
jgi:hypothetical protein